MIKFACLSLLLVSAPQGIVLAQDEPDFIARIERVFLEKAPQWKVENKIVQNEIGFFKQETTYKSGKVQAAVSITAWQREKDARDVFEASAIAFDNISRGRKIKKRLPGLGDENYIWVNRGSSLWPTIHFRQGRVGVTVFAPSVAVAKRFAQLVSEQLPPASPESRE